MVEGRPGRREAEGARGRTPARGRRHEGEATHVPDRRAGIRWRPLDQWRRHGLRIRFRLGIGIRLIWIDIATHRLPDRIVLPTLAGAVLLALAGGLFAGWRYTEIGGRERPAPSFYWQRHGAGAANAAGFGLPGPTAECHCPKSWGRF